MNWLDIVSNLDAVVCEDLAVRCYQGCDDWTFLCASYVNHCLNLEFYGNDSPYHKLSTETKGDFGDLEDYEDFEKTKIALEKAFSQYGVSWNNTKETLYKGIDQKSFYQILDLRNKVVGDKFVVHGYTSMTLSESVAESFSSADVILVCDNMVDKKCVFPPNKPVQNSVAGMENEEEVLFDKGLEFEIVGRETKNNKIHLYVKPV